MSDDRRDTGSAVRSKLQLLIAPLAAAALLVAYQACGSDGGNGDGAGGAGGKGGKGGGTAALGGRGVTPGTGGAPGLGGGGGLFGGGCFPNQSSTPQPEVMTKIALSTIAADHARLERKRIATTLLSINVADLAGHSPGSERVAYSRCDHVGPNRSGTSRAVKTPIGSTDSTNAVRFASNVAIAVERTPRAGSDTSISLQYSMTTYRDA